MDGDEEAYFNAEDDEVDDDDLGLPTLGKGGLGMPNGASPVRPLVNYPDDDEEEEGEMEHMQNILASSPDRDVVKKNGIRDGRAARQSLWLSSEDERTRTMMSWAK
ncbi:Platinum sensitivity protein [Teratosphaeriaceae sp. CCFEE 6253]|nr:Platinum sensitivity protein [Teratosphaeriaceae sp. CCFEE 6253]